MKTYPPKQIQQLFGISYRQIQFWDSTNFIKPSIRRRGRFRAYVYRDLVLFEIATLLRRQGYSIQVLRKILHGFKQKLPLDLEPDPRLKILVRNKSTMLVWGELLGSLPGVRVIKLDTLVERISNLKTELAAA